MTDRNMIFDSSDPHLISKFLKNKIEPLLPYSLSLYRRCQFYLQEVQKRKTSIANARIWIGVGEDSDSEGHQRWTEDQWLSQCEAEALQPESAKTSTDRRQNQEWLSAYIDLTNPGETQIWLFASWEPENFGKITSQEADSINNNNATKSTRIALFQRLYAYLRQDRIPLLSTTAPQRWQSLLDSGKLVSKPYIRSKILFGSIGESLWEYLEADVIRAGNATIKTASTKPKGPGQIDDGQPSPSSTIGRTRQDLSYLKYLLLFPASSSSSSFTSPNLPTEFRFGPLSDTHFQLMLDRTVIPRTIETLQSLISVGLFLNHMDNSNFAAVSSDPISWGLLGKDGSISSLHTEAEYRGKGLAEHVSRELARLHARELKLNLDNNDNDDIGSKNEKKIEKILTHADVSISNKSSQRVFAKMGGKAYWTVGWIELDIGE